MILDLTVFHPWREVTKLSIVPVIRHPHLRPDMQDFVIVDDDSTIVDHVLVDHRPIGIMSFSSRAVDRVTRMPMSHRIPSVSSDSKIFASTSHECKHVSPK